MFTSKLFKILTNPNKITKSLRVKKNSAEPCRRSTSTRVLSYKINDKIDNTIVINTKKTVKEKPVFTNLLTDLILYK